MMEEEKASSSSFDSGKIIDMIMGLLSVGLIGAVGWQFDTSTEHDKRIEKEETVTGYHDEQLKNLWTMKNEEIVAKLNEERAEHAAFVIELKEKHHDRIEDIERMHKNALDQKDFEIRMCKEYNHLKK